MRQFDFRDQNDYVEVGAGSVINDNSVIKYIASNHDTPPYVEVKSDTAWVLFHTDGFKVGQGFNITFTADLQSPIIPLVTKDRDPVIEGDDVTLTCSSSGIPPPVYTWYHNGEALDSHGRIHRIHGIDAADSGIYICNVTNKEDTRATSIHFNVSNLHSPSIPVVTIDRDPVIEGDDVTLTCSSSGIPPPVYTWYHNGEALNNHGKIHRIHGIDSADSGIYSCHVTNRKDTRATSIHFNVLNLQSPSIPVVTKDKDPVIEGDDVTLTCSSSGIPPPVYTWYHNGEALDSHGRIHKIHGINAADSGMYICHVTNREDTRSSSIYIDVLTPPSKIKNTTVSSVTDSLITVSWIPGYDGGSQQVFSIEYRKTSLHYSNGTEDDIHRTVNWSRTTTTNLTTHTLTGLQPSTSYILHVVSINVVGETKSDSIQVTTAGEPTKAISAIKLIILISLSVVACAAVSLIIAILWNATRRRRQPSDIQAVSNKGKQYAFASILFAPEDRGEY
ncbi:contactin-6-like [Ptychodera flava]|uniref:contactin-6-like n=1 Tax=Ptychodera flava TaxID=63121 RepID=UPI00396A0E83